MKNKDILFIALKNIFRNKIKFFLTSMSICIGVCSVIIITTIGNVGTTLIDEKLSSMGIDGLFVSNVYNDSVITMDLINTLEKSFEIDEIMPIVSCFGSFAGSRVSGQSVIWGVDENLYDTLKIKSIDGRCFNQNDIKYAKKVAIIDENLANELYGRVNILGKNINITFSGISQDFEIIGVISDQKEIIDSFLGENSVSFIYVPYTVVQEISQNDEISQMAIRSSQNLDELKARLEFYFSKNKNLDGMLEVQNISSYIDTISEIMKYLTIILSFVAGISMFVAGIGVLNIMLSSTIERKREIGIYMAIGARNSEIGKIFLVESIIICVFSGVFGALVGILTVFFCVSAFLVPFSINFKSILIVEIISLVCGIFAGIIPAIKASRLNPIDVLRE
ncbi:MAG: ABC transporter permease [Clostridia bacterium]